MQSFSAKIFIIGINPYVLIPSAILKEIFKQAGKEKGPIPVRGKINDHAFTQTLVKYSGKWRLYINGPMLKGANASLGDRGEIEIEFNPTPAQIAMPEKLKTALEKNKKAAATFSKLPPSRQKEIMRYIANLKSQEAIENNIKRVIGILLGKERFVGRDKP